MATGRKGRPQSFGKCLSAGQIGRGEQRDELFPAKASHDAPAILRRLPQENRQPLDHIVADAMAEAVVDLLEMVDVTDQQSGRHRRARLPDDIFGGGEKATSVVDACQGVRQRLRGQFLHQVCRDPEQKKDRRCEPGQHGEDFE